MSKKFAVVVGATGIIGSNLLEHLHALDDWDVIGIARKVPLRNPERYVEMDLLNQKDIASKLNELKDVTHIFYAAYQDYPPFSDKQKDINLSMFRNIVETVELTSKSLHKIILITGAKAYGVHLGKFKTPAKESDPRHMPPNFYYNQEDFLQSQQQGKQWEWTIMRPDVVSGLSIGHPMSISMTIAVYAAISKELDLPLRFPGKELAYHALVEVTDALLLSRAAVWASNEKKTSFEIFNITNGDLFRWKYLWPKFADYFKMDYAPPQTLPLAEIMPLQQKTWNNIVDKYKLQKIPYKEVAGWPFADFIFGCEYDVIIDTTKIKQFGFHQVVDSETEFLRLFDRFKVEKLIP